MKHLILQGGIDSEVLLDDDVLTGIIYSDEFHAPIQERGTDPYFPNVSALEDWALDHDESPWGIAVLIAHRGIRPLRYFERGLIETEDVIFELIGEAVGQIIETGY